MLTIALGSIATIRHFHKTPFTIGIIVSESVADNQSEQVAVFNRNGWLFWAGIRIQENSMQTKSPIFAN